jgi:integrase/recombinase XerD
MGKVLAGWYRWQRGRGLSPLTIRRRRWAIGHATRCGLDLRTCTADDIETAMSRLDAPQTRRSFVSDLRSLYRWGVRRGHFTHDPTAGVDLPHVPQRLPTPLTYNQLRRALDCPDKRVRLLVMLGAYAGLRVSEMARLHTDDIDLDRMVLTVRQGKGSKDRCVPVAPELAPILAELPVGPVVGVSVGYISGLLRQWFRHCDIDRRPHDLRATFATAAAEATDGRLEVVAELLGHTNISTTRRYALFTPSTVAAVQHLYPL